MTRQEYDLELRRYNSRCWRAMFFLSGFEHSLTADAGSAWARSSWEAVQRAAHDALRNRELREARLDPDLRVAEVRRSVVLPEPFACGDRNAVYCMRGVDAAPTLYSARRFVITTRRASPSWCSRTVHQPVVS